MTTPAIIAPDVDLVVATYLRTALAPHGYTASNTRVSNSYKGELPNEVWIRSDGGPRLDIIRSVMRIGVNYYADGPTDANVSQLARTGSALLRVMPDGHPVIRVIETALPHAVADTRPRMYATYEIWTRGAPL